MLMQAQNCQHPPSIEDVELSGRAESEYWSNGLTVRSARGRVLTKRAAANTADIIRAAVIKR